MKLIERAEVASGVAWCSRKRWFWLSFNGEIYSFMLDLGRFSISIEKKDLGK